MNRQFERMVDQVVKYKPPPQEKKAKERMDARNAKKKKAKPKKP